MSSYAIIRVFGAIIFTAFITFIGSFGYHLLEGWRFVDSFYFIIMTIGTIGYGDFVPHSDFAKTLTIFFVLIKYPIGFYAGSIILSDRLCKLQKTLEADIGEGMKKEEKIIVSRLSKKRKRKKFY